MKTPDKSTGWPEGWLAAAAAGVIAAVMVRVVGDLGLVATLFIGVFVFLVFGVLLGLFWGAPVAGTAGHVPHGHGHPAASSTPRPQMPPASAPHARAAAESAPKPAAVEAVPLVASPPQVEAATLGATPVAEAAPLAVVVADVSGVREEPAAIADAPAVTTAAMVAAPVAAAAARQPVGLAAPRDGAADRLQAIEGIGPVLEKLCHDLGIFHFDQIGAWGPAEVAWMDGNLKGFRGRVTRDRWVAQARLIGDIGLEAFQRRAKTNDY